MQSALHVLVQVFPFGDDASTSIKWSVLKIGGPRASQQLVMFAIGLMLGDFTVGGIWSLISVVTQQPMYNFWP